MLRNYVIVALRNLWRRRLYTALNVAGLAVGMAVCLLIGLYVRDETSYDHFHEKGERIMAIMLRLESGSPPNPTPPPLAATLEETLPEVERGIRTWGGGSEVPVVRPETQFRGQLRVLYADDAFFETFSFPLWEGDPSNVLGEPDAVVITEGAARTFFGDEEPIGEALRIPVLGEMRDVTVRGIAVSVPRNSTIQFDLVASVNLLPEGFRDPNAWLHTMYRTYVLLNESASAESFDERMVAALRPHLDEEQARSFFSVPLRSVYLSDLHVTTGLRGKDRYMYVFGSIAVFVLLLAAINYVNLATAQATARAHEVGVRKALGAGRAELVRQFLSESIATSIAALLVAWLLVRLALPPFDALFDVELTGSLADVGPAAVAVLSMLVLLVGSLAGAYPAFVLSQSQPVGVLRKSAAPTTPSGGRLRQALTVFQFAVSFVLIVGTLVIHLQMGYAQTERGFDADDVIVVHLRSAEAWRLRDQLREDVLAHPGALRASVPNIVPAGLGRITMSDPPRVISPEAMTDVEIVTFSPGVVDQDFFELLNLRLSAGRWFSEPRTSDGRRAYVLNETAVATLGWTADDAVGMPFRLGRDDSADGVVVGVVEDFHVRSIHTPVDAVVLQLEEDAAWSSVGSLLARVSPNDVRGTIEYIEAVMSRYAPGEPFAYEFLDDRFSALYTAERRLGRIFTVFAALAVFVACLGLFGLATYAVETRTREVGVRKAFGASVADVVTLLSMSFLRLVLIAIVLATPVGLLIMHRWLEEFAYRINLGPGVFLVAGILVSAIALLTVGWHATRAALANPVDALRHE